MPLTRRWRPIIGSFMGQAPGSDCSRAGRRLRRRSARAVSMTTPDVWLRDQAGCPAATFQHKPRDIQNKPETRVRTAQPV
jgi:hypothetical protein